MYIVHGLHCYKQNDNYTDSWMKISYVYWNDDHTVFGRIISGMKFIPFFGMPSVKSDIIPTYFGMKLLHTVFFDAYSM